MNSYKFPGMGARTQIQRGNAQIFTNSLKYDRINKKLRKDA